MNIKSIISLAITVTFLMFSSLTIAEENSNNNKTTGSGPNPYKDCGIGAALFQETHWAAVTSNVIWDIGTTAIISATASPETCSGKQVKAAQFILDTYDNLAEESSQGQGEHLTTVLNIMECDIHKHDAIISDVRAGTASIVNSPNYDKQPRIEKATMLYKVVDSATHSCSA